MANSIATLYNIKTDRGLYVNPIATCGDMEVHHVQFFQTVSPALQPVAAGMKQGKQVQVRSELVRCEFILVVCKENDSPVNRIRHLL